MRPNNFNPVSSAIMKKYTFFLVTLVLEFSAGIPSDPIFRKLDPIQPYQYERDSREENHLVDLWDNLSDLAEPLNYNPRANAYHLFTRANPTTSQPLLINSPSLLAMTNYRSARRTIVLIHGWRDSIISDFTSVLVPAFLAAEDLNVIAVDWSAGSDTINYNAALANTVISGRGVAEFINWLNEASGSNAVQYHIVGHGLGGHQAGIVARNVRGNVTYVTGLDPSLLGWINNDNRFQPNDGTYTEVIHTDAGVNGFTSDLAQVDFYPNGGSSMPGCDSNACDHARSFFYFAESLRSGRFTGRQCANYVAALLGQCNILPGRLQMGGLTPKFGRTGVFLLQTNAAPPFSRG